MSQRRWRDGSLETDLPMRGLAEMFNVNYFLVSQVNPTYCQPYLSTYLPALSTLCLQGKHVLCSPPYFWANSYISCFDCTIHLFAAHSCNMACKLSQCLANT